MSRIRLSLVFFLLTSFVFSQEEEKSAHVLLQIRNELGEVFKGTILLIANKDTIPVTASWNNSFQTDLLPGSYRLILRNKLFNDYIIPSLFIESNEVKELNIVWPHRIIRLPEVRYQL